MSVIAAIICLVSAIITSFTHGNMQANNLMTSLQGPGQDMRIWRKYSIILDFALFWIIPLFIALATYGWWGFLYLPLVWITVSNLSRVFMIGQLKKRVFESERDCTEEARKYEESRKNDRKKTASTESGTSAIDIESVFGGRSAVNLNAVEHENHQLKWLISHPKMAHHLALSVQDNKARPEIQAAFEHQVSTLDAMSKKRREMND